ncbi:uncharacterized protein LOC112560677 isoform X3 [Pomacea canaliculata]|uniref:uncharacterized protein LOC112560677 isoform X3 n=1 Tax=Pomacea canaliculata TaxID=400727 RepID=UPI000D727239|nr:uncharacterized protein LOC112560677 isoform X3 [Pomacea canaliculata]
MAGSLPWITTLYSEPDPNTLSQEYLLRSVSSQTADAVTAMLSQAARALIEAEEKYRKALTILTDLTEQHMSVLGNEEEENIVWDIILQARYQLDVLNRKRKDLEILFSCVQKLADASAEVAFLAGTEFLSTSMGERMHNAQRHVESARAETERAEEILRETQAINVKITTEHAEKQKSECVYTDTDLEENVNKSAS